MDNNLVGKAEITVHAPVAKVWDAFVNPVIIKQYMFGTTVATDWKEGTPITWSGVWKDKPYEDKGVILQIVPEHTLQYSHFSPMSGAPDVPENYHTVTVTLSDRGEETGIVLTQDNNKTPEERANLEKNWAMMLEALKKVVEG